MLSYKESGLEGTQVINHNLGSRDVVVMLYTDDYSELPATIVHNTENQMTVTPGYVQMYRKGKKLIMGGLVELPGEYTVTVHV